MAATLSVISIVLFIAAGFFAVLAAVLWFVLRIPEVMGDLSGRTARKSIEKTRETNQRQSQRTEMTLIDEIMMIHTEEEI